MKRVLLKLSGEALAGAKHTGFDEPTVTEVAKQVKVLVDEGVEIGVVIGGGNFWRGRSSETIDRTKADQIGMLATVMNCIYVSEIFRSQGMMTAVLTPFPCGVAYADVQRIFQPKRIQRTDHLLSAYQFLCQICLQSHQRRSFVSKGSIR